MRTLPPVALVTAVALGSVGMVWLSARVAPAPLTVTSTAFANGGKIPKDHVGYHGKDQSPPLSWTGAPQGTRQFAVLAEDPEARSPFNPGVPLVLWVVYGIPGTAAGLPGRLKPGPIESGGLAGTIQGRTDLDLFRNRGGGVAPSIDTAEFTRPRIRGDEHLAHGGGTTVSGMARTSPVMNWVVPQLPPRYRGPGVPPEDVTHHYTFTVYAIDEALALPEGLDSRQLRAAIDEHIIAKGEVTGTFRR